MEDISLGVIGAGAVAKEHLRVLDDLDGVKIEVIASRTLSKAQKLASEHNIKTVVPVSEVFNHQVDGILVLVSAEHIFQITKDVLLQKIPVFMEKPPGLNVTGFMRDAPFHMIDIYILAVIVCYSIYLPYFIKDKLNTNKLGNE